MLSKYVVYEFVIKDNCLFKDFPSRSRFQMSNAKCVHICIFGFSWYGNDSFTNMNHILFIYIYFSLSKINSIP